MRDDRGDYRRAAAAAAAGDPVLHPAPSLRRAIAARDTSTMKGTVGRAQLPHRHSPGEREQRTRRILYFGEGARVFQIIFCKQQKKAGGFRLLLLQVHRACRVRSPALRRCRSGWRHRDSRPIRRYRGGSLPLKARPPKCSPSLGRLELWLMADTPGGASRMGVAGSAP